MSIMTFNHLKLMDALCVNNITLSELCRLSRVSRQSMADYLANLSCPVPNTVDRIAESLRISDRDLRYERVELRIATERPVSEFWDYHRLAVSYIITQTKNSQSYLAVLAGVPASYLGGLKSGRDRIRLPTLCELADIAGVDFTEQLKNYPTAYKYIDS